MEARTAAALCLDKVIEEGKSLDRALAEVFENIKDVRERAFTQNLCFGILRCYDQQQSYIDQLLEKPIRSKDKILNSVMQCGIYQLEHMRTPEHAAVSASVDSVKELGRPWAKGLVNAVLRRYLREHETLKKSKIKNEKQTYSHPEWIIGKLKKDWPDYWQDILENNNQHASMTLRLNTGKSSRDEYIKKLQESGMDGTKDAVSEYGIILSTPTDIDNIPGFKQGIVSVQDAGAQLAAPLLDLQPGHRVLDACAAPGGKTTHIKEIQPKTHEVIALDNNKERLVSLEDSKKRLAMDFNIILGSASNTKSWWDGKEFDRILVDAPCSASGVIRRHPDIKYLRNKSDIPALSQTQHDILVSLWPLLKRGGKLVYVTCSVFHDENDCIIEKFLSEVNDTKMIKISANWGIECKFGRQILPGNKNMDGYYFAIVQKLM